MMKSFTDKEELGEQERLPPTVTRAHPELSHCQDDKLVTLMARKGQDEECAFRACEELHARHAHTLVWWCIKHRFETLGKSAEDFVNQTFLRAYERTTPFICPTNANAAERSRRVRAWLFSIAKRLYYDEYDEEKKVINASAEQFSASAKMNGSELAQEIRVINFSAERQELINQFIENCVPVDKEILRATAEHWCASEKQTIMSDEVRDALCQKLGLTKVSLRVKRLRLLERLAVFILQNEKHPTIKTKQDNEYEAELR